jgi:hypothetical protein
MKHFTLLVMFVISVFGAFSQTQIDLPITWDVSTVNYTVEPIAGALPAVVADPVNSSNSVLEIVQPSTALTYAGVIFGETNNAFELANAIPFTATQTTISAKVYSPAVGVTYRLKVEGATASGIQCETDKVTTVANAWETLVFDLSNNAIPGDVLNPANTYVKCILFPDFGQSGGASATYYVDSVYFGGTVVTSNLAPIDLPISWDDTANVDYSVTPFEGAVTSAALDPSNATNNVLKFEKPTGAQPWAGVSLGTAALANPIPFTVTDNLISAKIYSPAAGSTIRLKTEVDGNPTLFVEVDMTTTVANGWETLTFDFSAPAGGVLDYNLNYDVLSVFFDFLEPAAGQVFYLDSVQFGLPAPPPPAEDTSFVTFQVDMNNYGVAFTTPEVNGTFNGWCGNCSAMSDANSDNIWDVTVPVVGDTFEFKFSHDNWTGQEALTEGLPCTITTNGFTNRLLVVIGDTTLPVVCWDECIGCGTPPDTANVTFRVDMRGYTGTYTTPEVNGTFNGWCGSCNAMTDANNDSIWEITVGIAADSIEFKFSHDNWTGQEDLTDSSTCTKTTIDGTSIFVNRFEFLNGDVVLPVVCWDACEACENSVGVEDLNIGSSLSLYPNPSNDILNVRMDNSNENYSITLTDMLGKSVMSTTLRGSELTTINTSNLSEGLYLMTVTNEISVYTTKVVISH